MFYGVFYRGSLWLFLNQVFLGYYGFYDVGVYDIYGFYARVLDENFEGVEVVLEGFWVMRFWKCFLCVLKIFFCEVSVTTITQMCKYEQIFNVKLPPCKYRKYFNFLIWAIQKLTVSHFLIPTILICFVGIFNCKLL